jgi:hypothetical protein
LYGVDANSSEEHADESSWLYNTLFVPSLPVRYNTITREEAIEALENFLAGKRRVVDIWPTAYTRGIEVGDVSDDEDEYEEDEDDGFDEVEELDESATDASGMPVTEDSENDADDTRGNEVGFFRIFRRGKKRK